MKPRVPASFRLLALIALLAFPLARANVAPAASPHLQVANPTHDFGQITPGQTLRYEFRISNTGTAPLEISEVRPSCGCTTADQWPHRLTPGASGTIPVEIDTSDFSGDVTRTLSIVSNDPRQQEVVLTLKTTAWLPIQVTPRIIILPAVGDPNQIVSRTAKLTNETSEPLALSDVQSDDPRFKPELRELIPGKTFELTVTTVPPLPEGTHLAQIRLKTSNAKLPELSVEAVATILPALQIAPLAIALPAIKLTAPETRYIVILDHRDAELAVSDVSTNAPGVTITATAATDRRQVTLTLTFPTGFTFSGGEKFLVRGKTNQPGAPTFEVPIISTPSD